jgi:hypothetical protein
MREEIVGGGGEGGGVICYTDSVYFCLAWFSKQCVTFDLALNVVAPVVSFTEVAYMWQSDIKTAP